MSRTGLSGRRSKRETDEGERPPLWAGGEKQEIYRSITMNMMTVFQIGMIFIFSLLRTGHFLYQMNTHLLY
jgi:hypothetical protein